MASLDIMELNPALDVRNKTAVLAVDLVESLFGKSTLMRHPARGSLRAGPRFARRRAARARRSGDVNSTGVAAGVRGRPCRYYCNSAEEARYGRQSSMNLRPTDAGRVARGGARARPGRENQAVDRLLQTLELTGGARHRAVALAVALVEGARARRDERPFLDAFLQEFGLSNQEGIALMCIAEALLRIPDDATADRLIAEQLATGDWSAHAGKSESLFVNASTWGLMLTGGMLELDPAIKTDAAAGYAS